MCRIRYTFMRRIKMSSLKQKFFNWQFVEALKNICDSFSWKIFLEAISERQNDEDGLIEINLSTKLESLGAWLFRIVQLCKKNVSKLWFAIQTFDHLLNDWSKIEIFTFWCLQDAIIYKKSFVARKMNHLEKSFIMNSTIFKFFCFKNSTADNESFSDVLPDDVLIMIFELLDFRSLKEAALVCKRWEFWKLGNSFIFSDFRWNSVIGTTNSIINRFVLKLKNHSEADIKQLIKLSKDVQRFKRNYTSVHVDMDGSEGLNAVAKLLINFGPFLKELKIFCKSAISIKSCLMKDVLRNMPELRILHMNKLEILPESSGENISMMQLEDLKVGVRSCRIVEIISAPKLRGFENLMLESFYTEKIHQLMRASNPSFIFSNREKMESFYYHCSENEEPVSGFRYDKFDFHNHFKMSNMKSFEAFQSFLRRQADSLTTFNSHSMKDRFNTRGLYKIIFGELKALTILTMDFSMLPADRDFYD